MTTKKIFGTKELEKSIGGLTFGKLLESHRLSQEVSQRELSKLLGISPSSLCDLEKGRKIPSPSRADSIAAKLGLSRKLWVKTALQDQLREQGLKYIVSVA